ncbi:MAG TPA: hypothetical protein VFO19_16785 [Vicinamibacterales bacterium]|nr:hypothetical protein [Vicinamibacterales bacterium]
MTARRDAFVLAVLLFGVATAAGAQGREGGYGWPAAGLAVAGDLSAVIGPVDNDAFFNYTDYEQNALRLARLRLVAEWRPATRLSFVTEIRAESSDALDAAAWYVRWEPFGDALRIQAGRVPPVIGAYARRAYGRDQFGFAPPVPYQYLTSLRPDALPLTIDDVLDMRGRGWRPIYPVGDHTIGPGVPLVSGLRWDTGVQASWHQGRIEIAGAITQGAPSVPVVEETNDGVQVSGRIGVALPFGATVGFSGASGRWIERAALDAMPAGGSRKSTQSLIGVDAEVGRGRWLIRGEWLWNTFEVPLAGAPYLDTDPFARLGSGGGYVEGRYRPHPRWQLALGAGTLQFDRVARFRDGALMTWDAPVTRLEGVLSYRVTRHLDVRGGWQYNWRDGGRVKERGYPNIGLLYWF